LTEEQNKVVQNLFIWQLNELVCQQVSSKNIIALEIKVYLLTEVINNVTKLETLLQLFASSTSINSRTAGCNIFAI
jgi:hypothetical protein